MPYPSSVPRHYCTGRSVHQVVLTCVIPIPHCPLPSQTTLPTDGVGLESCCMLFLGLLTFLSRHPLSRWSGATLAVTFLVILPRGVFSLCRHPWFLVPGHPIPHYPLPSQFHVNHLPGRWLSGYEVQQKSYAVGVGIPSATWHTCGLARSTSAAMASLALFPSHSLKS
jgi:hypothetical protein